MLDILTDVVKLSFFLLFHCKGSKQNQRERRDLRARRQQLKRRARSSICPRAEEGGGTSPAHWGSALSWGTAELAPEMQSHLPALAARKKGFFIAS